MSTSSRLMTGLLPALVGLALTGAAAGETAAGEQDPKAAPKAQEPKAQEPKAQEPKAQEPKAQEPKAQEPKRDKPKAEEPVAEPKPKVEEPAAEQKPEAKTPKAKPEPKADDPAAEPQPDAKPPAAEDGAKEPKAKPEAPTPEPPPAPPKEPAEERSVPARVVLQAPEVKGGEVPLLDRMLAKMTSAVTRCVNDHGGLSGQSGEIELRMLVRARGRAEGVETSKHRAVSKGAARCVRKTLKNKWLGTPSKEPVQVTVRYGVEAADGKR